MSAAKFFAQVAQRVNYDDWHAGRGPLGISTQDEQLAARRDPEVAARKLANYLRVLVLETQTLARACGKSHVHDMEPEDLVALTVEAAAMARVAGGHQLDSRYLGVSTNKPSAEGLDRVELTHHDLDTIGDS